ncbi:MAG: hypothetical protein QG582_881 [Candidatus Thermoplasmatota archaeon]|nr:hypothetical protein [Candidatus Thermoplasmatota archaeon]
MSSDLTAMDSSGWETVKKALNQRVVITRSSLVPSFRNRVWLVETDVRPVVVKRSLSGLSAVEFETTLLAKKAGLLVPYPLYMDKDYIVSEFISGERCSRLVSAMFNTAAAEGIGRWLGGFHDSMESFGKPLAMRDAVLDNFIMHEGEVFGVDLEDTSPGDPMDDLGQMASSILGNEPFFTPIKFDLCFSMLDAYEERTGMESRESVRPFVAKHLRLSVRARPLYRRPFEGVAKVLDKAWPDLA